MSENKEKQIRKFRVKPLDIVLACVALGVAAWLFIKPWWVAKQTPQDDKKIMMFAGDLEIEIPFKDQTINLMDDFVAADLKTYNVRRNMVLEVKDRQARVVSSDCPDKVCVHSGWASQCGHVAICMPNAFGILISCDKANEDK